jgi:hypothetical protein
MAAIFLVSTRTVNRWEASFGISAQRKNARVLRYGLDCVVGLVASGMTLDNAVAERLGLNPTAILALASSIARRPNPAYSAPTDQPVELADEDNDYRRLLVAWGHADVGPVLRKIVRALTG